MRSLKPVWFTSLEELGTQLFMVKFLPPLSQDVKTLPNVLTTIDTICHLEPLAHEMVAVDDPSGGGPAAEAGRYAHFMPLWLIRQRERRGRAMAFRTAVEAACRQGGDNDLLVPIDPCRCPEPRAVLRAMRAARLGWDAVVASTDDAAGRTVGASRPREVTVYHARLVKRH